MSPVAQAWLVVGGLALLVFGGAFWYLIGWRNRVLRQPEVPATPEPETPQEQTTIAPASGHVIDPEAANVIGNPLLRWGKPERRRYVPDDYDGDIACLLCHRDILPGQFFWETPLIERETGEEIDTSFQLCLSCQPGDVAAVIHRDA